jgi:hypothetical protein
MAIIVVLDMNAQPPLVVDYKELKEQSVHDAAHAMAQKYADQTGKPCHVVVGSLDDVKRPVRPALAPHTEASALAHNVLPPQVPTFGVPTLGPADVVVEMTPAELEAKLAEQGRTVIKP